MATSTQTNPGWRVQLAIHRAVRRDVLPALNRVRRKPRPPPPGRCRPTGRDRRPTPPPPRVRGHRGLALMGERLGAQAEGLLAGTGHEHEAMAAAMGQFDAALSTTSTDDRSGPGGPRTHGTGDRSAPRPRGGRRAPAHPRGLHHGRHRLLLGRGRQDQPGQRVPSLDARRRPRRRLRLLHRGHAAPGPGAARFRVNTELAEERRSAESPPGGRI